MAVLAIGAAEWLATKLLDPSVLWSFVESGMKLVAWLMQQAGGAYDRANQEVGTLLSDPNVPDIDVAPFTYGIYIGIALYLLLGPLIFYWRTVRPLLALQYPDRIKPKQRKLTDQELAALRSQNNGGRQETSEWLNIVLSRLFAENAKSVWFEEAVRLKILGELVDLQRTPLMCLIKGVRVTDLYLGASPPRVTNITVIGTHSTTHEMTALFDVFYRGALSMVINLELRVGMTICILARIREVRGRMSVSYLSPLLRFAFFEDPTIHCDIESLIGGRRLPIINPLLRYVIRLAIRNVLTLPKGKTVWVRDAPPSPPYPWNCNSEDEMYEFTPVVRADIAALCAKPPANVLPAEPQAAKPPPAPTPRADSSSSVLQATASMSSLFTVSSGSALSLVQESSGPVAQPATPEKSFANDASLKRQTLSPPPTITFTSPHTPPRQSTQTTLRKVPVGERQATHSSLRQRPLTAESEAGAS